MLRRRAIAAAGEQHVVGLLRAELDGVSEPAAQTIASATFDFPEPLGPTTTATPGSSFTSTVSGNDLNPRSLRERRCMQARRYPEPRTALVSQRSRSATIAGSTRSPR